MCEDHDHNERAPRKRQPRKTQTHAQNITVHVQWVMGCTLKRTRICVPCKEVFVAGASFSHDTRTHRKGNYHDNCLSCRKNYFESCRGHNNKKNTSPPRTFPRQRARARDWTGRPAPLPVETKSGPGARTGDVCVGGMLFQTRDLAR